MRPTPIPSLRWIRCAALAGLFLAGCNFPTASSSEVAPAAWIDAPLNGSSLPPEPLEVIWHAAASGGVAMVEFGVNGSSLEVAPPSNPGGVFVTGSQSWVPSGEGNYVLQVRAQDEGGVWSPAATALITVLRSTPTPNPTPTETATPENTPTLTPTPATVAPFGIERVRISTDRVAYEGGGGCAPMDVTVLVRATDPAGVGAVVLFYRLRNAASGETTDFFSAAMNPQGGDLYSMTINPADDIISHVGFPGSGEAWLQYQAVLQNTQGETGTRTPLLSDITVVGC